MDSPHRLFLFLERRIRMKKNWQSESLDMDQLFPGGYVIELETGRYLNNCNGKKIRSSPFDRAKHFPNRHQVKTYMDLHFPYIGFPIFICEVLWVLLSHRYELEGITEYWTGTGFSTQFQNAITFNTYKEAYGYQKTQGLLRISIIEQQCFRREHLSKKELKMTGLPEILKGKSYFQPRDYLRSLRKAPILEQLVKAKLKTLSYEVLENPLKISSFQDHGALHLRLGISKDALKRLRKNDGDMKYLTWLQEENRSPHYLDDELIFWYMENHIEPNELNFIHTKMSYVQIRNYLIRQKGKRKDSISQVLTTWKDYISMAKRVKMNINDEIVYRATKLYKRHNDLIKYIEDNQLSVTAGELADKYPNINSVLSGLREKYEYSDETFTILAPRCIEDILKEGQALHHCIDKKTEYLERINEQETYILFLRNTKQPDTPYYTLEVEPGGVIRQKRTEYDRQNKDIEAASAFLREWQLEIQKRITENDRELANRSRQLRMESYAEMRKKKVKINGGLFQGKYLADVLEADLMEMPDTLQQAAYLLGIILTGGYFVVERRGKYGKVCCSKFDVK